MTSLQAHDITLTKEEYVVSECTFCYSILLFFIKSSLYLTNKRLIAHIPNVVLFVFPLGSNTATYPLRNIAAVSTKTRFKFFRLILAFFLVTTGLALVTESMLGVILLLMGALLAIESFIHSISMQSSSAAGVFYRIAFWEQSKARDFTNQVNETLAEI